ncbi:MAG: adenine phosphoribosyltransferase [Candidatus Aminicenantes bacterium]|nr:adenine phosphoribosyltransferase [Candidatus Aminicenantes bacterium]
MDLKKFIRDVPDFPVKGIVFKDITPLLLNHEAFSTAVDSMTKPFEGEKIDKILAIESRGFIFGAPMALKLGAGLIIARKQGKLPWKKVKKTYTLEYGEEILEVHQDAIEKDDRILIVDDLIATGGTARAMAELVEEMGGKVAGCAFLVELTFLEGRKLLKGYRVETIIKY